MSVLKFDYQFKYYANENINQRKCCYFMLWCTRIRKKSPGTSVYSAWEPDEPNHSILLDQFQLVKRKTIRMTCIKRVDIRYLTSPVCTEKLKECNEIFDDWLNGTGWPTFDKWLNSSVPCDTKTTLARVLGKIQIHVHIYLKAIHFIYFLFLVSVIGSQWWTDKKNLDLK